MSSTSGNRSHSCAVGHGRCGDPIAPSPTPNSGEAHLAVAEHLYWGYLDYDHAREELKLAQQSLPNEPYR